MRLPCASAEGALTSVPRRVLLSFYATGGFPLLTSFDARPEHAPTSLKIKEALINEDFCSLPRALAVAAPAACFIRTAHKFAYD